MLGPIPIRLVGAMAKLGVHGGKDLFGVWWALGEAEAVCVVMVEVVQGGIL
jgi:hypothetical protein